MDALQMRLAPLHTCVCCLASHPPASPLDSCRSMDSDYSSDLEDSELEGSGLSTGGDSDSGASQQRERPQRERPQRRQRSASPAKLKLSTSYITSQAQLKVGAVGCWTGGGRCGGS